MNEVHDITIKQTYEDFEDAYTGIYNDEEVLFFNAMDAGSITYSCEKVEDIVIFGMYPGMDEETAVKELESYGFYEHDFGIDDAAEKNYITGGGLGNMRVWYRAENGVLTELGMSGFCMYAS